MDQDFSIPQDRLDDRFCFSNKEYGEENIKIINSLVANGVLNPEDIHGFMPERMDCYNEKEKFELANVIFNRLLGYIEVQYPDIYEQITSELVNGVEISSIDDLRKAIDGIFSTLFGSGVEGIDESPILNRLYDLLDVLTFVDLSGSD